MLNEFKHQPKKVRANIVAVLGHEEVNCFEIIRYPSRWGSRVKAEDETEGPVVVKVAKTEVEEVIEQRHTQQNILFLDSNKNKRQWVRNKAIMFFLGS